jgi:hypothetical protein
LGGSATANTGSLIIDMQASVTFAKSGGRRVELFVPFDLAGVHVDAIDIGPVKLDHVLRWSAGEFVSALALLSALSGLKDSALRELRYPDADRVFGVFLDMLPDALRKDIEAGVVPQRPEDATIPTVTAADETNPPPIRDPFPNVGNFKREPNEAEAAEFDDGLLSMGMGG